MTIRSHVLTIGALAGVLGAALEILALANLPPVPAGVLGLAVAAAPAATRARLIADVLGRRLVVHLAQLDDDRRDPSAPLPPPLDWPLLDEALEAFHQSLL